MSALKTNVNTTDYVPMPPDDEQFHYLTRVGVEGRPFRSGFVIAEVMKESIDADPVDGAVFVLEGFARVRLADGQQLELRPGDFVSFEKGVSQNWEIVERFKAAVVFLGR